MAMLEYIGVFIAILFFIFIHNWRCNNDAIISNWLLIGMLPATLHNLSNIHDYVTLVLKQHGGTLRFKGPWFTNMNYIFTNDPMNVHHITSKNFGNYGKGSNFHEIFEGFGDGIFNSDSHEWKRQRTILHSLLKRKSFEIFLQKNIRKKLENCLLPFLDHASKEGAQVDLQDTFERFTFDSICSNLFGFDPNCLPNKLTELSDIAHQKALPVINDVICHRHTTPRFLWKLQKWLQIGQERKFKVAQENLDQFLHESITYSKYEVQRRCSSTEQLEESPLELVQALMKENDGNGKMSDKFLRDTALNLLTAGNGTLTAGLSWFFWLLSTHPVVEAKILQEIKDNCLTQEENRIMISSVDELGKLVYLHGAICEALRLFPPAPVEHKCAIKSDRLPSGDHVSANTKILYFIYSMGRMEQTWGEDCLEFKPERWISERGHIVHIPSYKFMAFNAGPRSCLGKDITLIEMKMVAAAILCKFQIKVVEGHPVTPQVSAILRMKHGLKVKVTKRCIT